MNVSGMKELTRAANTLALKQSYYQFKQTYSICKKTAHTISHITLTVGTLILQYVLKPVSFLLPSPPS